MSTLENKLEVMPELVVDGHVEEDVLQIKTDLSNDSERRTSYANEPVSLGTYAVL